MTSASLTAPRRAASLSAAVDRRALLLAMLVVLVGLSAWLRLANLADNPGWDGDEGYNWSIATNLAAGHAQRFALRYTFVDHPPFFYLLAAAVIRAWTPDLLALRTLSALCGVLTVVGLYGLGTRIGGGRLGLAAATIYALWPQAILQARWAYTYNLVAPLLVLTLWAALPHREEDGTSPHEDRPRRAAVMAGLLAGLALATDQEAIALVATIGFILWRGGGLRLAVAGLAMAAVPPALYIGWMLATRRDAFLFDIGHTATRLGGHGPIGQIGVLLVRLVHLGQFDSPIVLGLFGLLLLPRGIPRTALLVQTALLLLVVLQVRDPVPYFRAAIPVLPLCALGLGALTVAVLAPLARMARSRRRLAWAIIAAIGVGVLGQDVSQVAGHFPTAIASSLPVSTTDARAMARWVNARLGPADVVIAMPQTAWLMQCRTAELLEAVAIGGHGTEFYPDGLGPGRFAYDPRLQASRFLIVDRFTRLWIQDHAAERTLVSYARLHWPRVYAQGEYAIYANPLYASSRVDRPERAYKHAL